MSRLTYRHTVKAFHYDVDLRWDGTSNSWLLQSLVRGVPSVSIVVGRSHGIDFVAPEPDAKGHYIYVRGAFIDLPEESWRELKCWYESTAAAVAPAPPVEDLPRNLPPIAPPLAQYAKRAHA
ncbi:hypothetical protein [Xanthomonas axonopodis]|uniref:Uncharacterized protein n=1 Tax=Xanthomonas axonopodis pv. cajani TaxID=487827 RepID=A0ABX3M672_9XANT|nr:hypothetical protein [Xanthomonas axonopodis]OOX08713.1 hypothetical protein Xcaj_18630 [Xanthomonas axonopodis pv. cajani]